MPCNSAAISGFSLFTTWRHAGCERSATTLSVFCVCVFAFAVVWGGFGEAKAKLLRWETFGTAFDPPIPATIKPLILLTLFLLAIQSISNLIYDWNADPESHNPADEIDVLVDATSLDHLPDSDDKPAA